MIVLGNFNARNLLSQAFMSVLTSKNILKEPKCDKNPNNLSYNNLILSNKIRGFQNSCCIETGPWYFHKITVSTLKLQYLKLAPITFSNENFINSVSSNITELIMGEVWHSAVKYVSNKALNEHAPRKQKLIRGNHIPFMNREVHKQFWNEQNYVVSILKNVLMKLDWYIQNTALWGHDTR